MNASDGLWVKEMTELQQPTVHFKHIALLAVEGSAVGECLPRLRMASKHQACLPRLHGQAGRRG